MSSKRWAHSPTRAAGIVVDDLHSSPTPRAKRIRLDASQATSPAVSGSLTKQSSSFNFRQTVDVRKLTPTTQFSRHAYVYAIEPPTATELLATIEDYDEQTKVYQAPYYAKEADAPDKPREYAGLRYFIQGGRGISALDPWVSHCLDPPVIVSRPKFAQQPGWEFAGYPPSRKQVELWLQEEHTAATQSIRSKAARSQVR